MKYCDLAGIVAIPDQAMWLTLREILPDTIAKAIYGSPPKIIAKFRKNVTPGGWAYLEDRIKTIGKVSDRKSINARVEIWAWIGILAAEGRIHLSHKSLPNK
ncbi:MAG: FliG C-terminal domain-containing protein, partial [Chloroflexota bacterium]